MNKLLQRVVTAVILVSVLLIVFFRLPPVAAIALVAAFVLIAAWEWSGFLWLETFGVRIGYVLTVAAAMALALRFAGAAPGLQILLAASLAWWVIAFAWVLRYPVTVRPLTGAFCGIMVLVPAWAAIVGVLLTGEHGPAYVILVLAIVWAADVGAYFIGRRLGHRRLAPKVSPGKTWEGVAGGLLAAAAAAAAGAAILKLPALVLVPLAVIAAAVSIIGDLTVSMFKRSAGLKDSGHLFPGHGGVLDRIDSVTAAAPLFVLGASALGLLDL